MVTVIDLSCFLESHGSSNAGPNELSNKLFILHCLNFTSQLGLGLCFRDSQHYLFFIYSWWRILIYWFGCWFQIPHLRPAEYKRSRLSRNRRTLNRAYGGVLSGGAVRERWVSHFFETVFALPLYSYDYRNVRFSWFYYFVFVGSSEPSWLKSRRLWRRFWRSKRPRKSKLRRVKRAERTRSFVWVIFEQERDFVLIMTKIFECISLMDCHFLELVWICLVPSLYPLTLCLLSFCLFAWTNLWISLIILYVVVSCDQYCLLQFGWGSGVTVLVDHKVTQKMWMHLLHLG